MGGFVRADGAPDGGDHTTTVLRLRDRASGARRLSGLALLLEVHRHSFAILGWSNVHRLLVDQSVVADAVQTCQVVGLRAKVFRNAALTFKKCAVFADDLPLNSIKG